MVRNTSLSLRTSLSKQKGKPRGRYSWLFLRAYRLRRQKGKQANKGNININEIRILTDPILIRGDGTFWLEDTNAGWILDVKRHGGRHHILRKRASSVALCNRAVRDYTCDSRPPPPRPFSTSVSASLIRILFLRLFPPLGTSYVVAKERRKRGGVWPGLRGGLRGGGSAAARSVGTDNEKGKLFRFLPLIPLLALGARLEGEGPSL